MTPGSFDEYLKSLAAVSPQPVGGEPEALELCARMTAAVSALRPLDRRKLAHVVAADPATAPVLAAVVGLSQERFKTWLQAQFATAGWVALARRSALELVAALDEQFSLVSVLETQAEREWTWADVLARVMSPRQHAGSSVQQGRALEDAVEERVNALGVPYVVRTRFRGRATQTAPADFALPTGDDALIVVAVKGFDSTGSKLSDAAREIEQMVEAKTPRQFVFAIVDGQGWLRRRGDLRRIHNLAAAKLIDGLYTRGQLGEFESALREAAARLGLL